LGAAPKLKRNLTKQKKSQEQDESVIVEIPIVKKKALHNITFSFTGKEIEIKPVRSEALPK